MIQYVDLSHSCLDYAIFENCKLCNVEFDKLPDLTDHSNLVEALVISND